MLPPTTTSSPRTSGSPHDPAIPRVSKCQHGLMPRVRNSHLFSSESHARSAWPLPGRCFGKPRPPQSGMLALTSGVDWVTSCRLAPVNLAANGMPFPSVTKWYLVPRIRKRSAEPSPSRQPVEPRRRSVGRTACSSGVTGAAGLAATLYSLVGSCKRHRGRSARLLQRHPGAAARPSRRSAWGALARCLDRSEPLRSTQGGVGVG